MIIGKINNINIDSSLLNKISVECITSKCIHHGCCCNESAVTSEDIKNIDTYLPEILTELSPDIQKLITDRKKNHGYLEFDEKRIRTIGRAGENWEYCIFLINNKCKLERYNITPLSCNVFPLILDNNVLMIKNFYNLDCPAHGTTPAYILLKKEIILLFGNDFYQKLVTMFIPLEKSGLFYLRGI